MRERMQYDARDRTVIMRTHARKSGGWRVARWPAGQPVLMGYDLGCSVVFVPSRGARAWRGWVAWLPGRRQAVV